LTDAVSFAVMEATTCRHVLGFDRDFAVAGFTLWHGGG
jgi:predicted nucleic acid-binding protein